MRVKSAIDVPVSILIFAVIALLCGCLFIVPAEARLLLLIPVTLMIAFLLSLYFFTYYELREDCLYCRSGPFVEKIPYKKIRSVKLSRNLLSSMALSSKRIEIRQYGKGYLTGTTLISPKNREQFLKDLQKRCPAEQQPD